MSIETAPDISSIHRSFLESDLGSRLSSTIRWDKYRPDDVSHERWRELLGADVLVSTHTLVMIGIGRVGVHRLNFHQPGYLDTHEEQVELFALGIHDWGETVKKDINHLDKTEEDHAEEMDVLSIIVDDFFRDEDPYTRELAEEAVEVVKDQHTKLGRLFNTIERVGYFRTALHAANRVSSGSAPDCEASLRSLVASVLTTDTEELIQRSHEYKPIWIYLDKQKKAIDNAIEVARPLFHYPLDDLQRSNMSTFRKSVNSWHDWQRGQ